MEQRTQNRKATLVIMQVLDNEGNPVEHMSSKNIKVLKTIKKLEPEMFEELQNTPGAFIVKM